jgi:hypothetical protein
MTASILVCEYIKHGMTCELGGGGFVLLVVIGACSLCVIGAIGSRR